MRRSAEAEAFLATVQDTPPNAVSACHGWTAHEVTAHLAAGAAEISRHLDPHLQGDPVPATQNFEVREPPFRALQHDALLRRLDAEERKLCTLMGEVLTREPEAVVPWTGRRMAVAKFVPHLRSEFAIHRWDVAGDDEIGSRLLAHPELTEHAVTVLGPLLLDAGAKMDPLPGKNFAVRLRARGAKDLRVVIDGGQASLELVDDDGVEPYAEADAAARILIMWGRRPEVRGSFRSCMPASMLARMQVLLSGY